jgi:nucleoside 2-deoxyribosyltransferase
MKIYIAAPFREQATVRRLAEELQLRGHECTSSWRFEEPTGDGSESAHEEKYIEAAGVDLADIDRTDMLVLLGGESRTGGKHFETGYAVARGKHVVLIGAPENVFHWNLKRYATWAEFLREDL